VNRPVFRSLQAHLRDATHDARWLRDEAVTDGHRAAFDACMFHLGQATRIVGDVVEVDQAVEQANVEAAQRDLETLQEYAAQRDTEGEP
jgi:hypothetical protein